VTVIGSSCLCAGRQKTLGAVVGHGYASFDLVHFFICCFGLSPSEVPSILILIQSHALCVAEFSCSVLLKTHISLMDFK